uniref:Uncharacterized protein n=1 Tax=Oryza meridionalis TaxID=40149 RepID=A0A0E0F4D2_9ORYZ
MTTRRQMEILYYTQKVVSSCQLCWCMSGPGRSDGEDGFTVATTIMRQSTDSGESWHSKLKVENDLRL